jgi:hypothetical protein
MNSAGGSFLSLAAVIFSLSACSRDPVSWSDVRYSLAGTPANAVGDSASGADSVDVPIPIPDSGVCRSSVRVARARKSFFAVWWSLRPDSSVELKTSRSDDGAPWTRPAIVDSTDGSRRGCARPASSIATDPVSGYVHFAYFLDAASGTGVFAAHSMDRDSSFHAAVAMVYGSRPSNTSIAAEGDRVAVAYEDPNSLRPQIVVALSKTMGHLFETRMPVSGESAAATDPVVKLRGTKLEVSWTERSDADSTSERHASRTGIWK